MFRRRKTPAVHRVSAGGFSLVEIMVAIVVILVIAAIAVPNLLRARIKANEASAVASMNAIHTAEVLYSGSYPQTGYADNLAALGSNGSDCATPSKSNSCIIMDDTLTSGLKSGYIFDLVGDGNTPVMNYTLTATPESTISSGQCIYTSDASGQIASSSPNTGGKFSSAPAGSCKL